MYEIVVTNQFKKDIKRLQKRGYDMNVMKEAIIKLTESGQLPPVLLPHKLSGNYFGHWEAHLKSDWLIIWKIFEEQNEIWLTRSGTHSDLFK